MKWFLALVLAVIVAVSGFWLLMPSSTSSPQDEVASAPDEPVGASPPAPERANTPPQPAPAAPPADAPIILAPRDAPAPEPEIALEELVMEAPPAFEEDETRRDVGFYFATNRTRAANPDSDDPASQFTDDNGPLIWGTGLVSIPRDHRMGNLESQGWFASMLGLAPNEEKHVILQDMTPRPLDDVMAELMFDLETENSILMYVHGFNTSLDKAARRTGQLAYDLTWDGPAFLFSWPSHGSAVRYFHDRNMAERSVPRLEETFRELAAREPDRIIVIAHSMGTYVTSAALANMIRDNDPTVAKITTVILAAPDIDQEVFMEQLAPRFRNLTTPKITLYASSEDDALKLSKSANGEPRIGDTTNGVPIIEGIDVIDASGVTSDFFNHTYFGDNASILSDIYDMIHADMPVESRPMLAPMPPEARPPTHWLITNVE